MNSWLVLKKIWQQCHRMGPSSQVITMWSWTNLEPSWISDWGWLTYLKWWLGVTTSSAKMPHTEPYWNTLKPFWAAHWAAVASTSEGHDRSRRPMMARHWAAFNITSAIMPEPMCWWMTFLNINATVILVSQCFCDSWSIPPAAVDFKI